MAEAVELSRLWAQQDQAVVDSTLTTPTLDHTVAVGYLVAVHCIRTGGVDPVTPTLAGWAQNWAQISDVLWSATGTGARRRTTLFWVLAESTGAGSLIVSWSAPPTMASLHVLAAVGASDTIVQIVEQPYTNSSGLNEPITLAPLADAGNRVAAFAIVNVDCSPTMVPETIADGGDADWTLGYVLGESSTPTNSSISVFLDVEPGSTTPGYFQTTQGAGTAYAVGVEIQRATDDPPPVDSPGCEIGTSGYRLLIELFYNPDAGIRRFGSELFGSEIFGSQGGSGVPRWVDMTRYCSGAALTRGAFQASTSTPTDQLVFDVYDPAGELVDWLPPGSLSSPQLNTPVRLSIIPPAPWEPRELFVGTIDSMVENHENVNRQITITTLATRAQLVTNILLPDRPQENAQERIAWALDEIGWTYGVVYPPDLADYGLEQDTEPRFGVDSLALTIITEACNSAGYGLYTTREGVLAFFPLTLSPIVDPLVTIGDCYSPGVDSLANTIQYGSDARTVLNIVQLVNKGFPNRSREAKDLISIEKYGRRADGYGFPLTVVNQSGFDAQTVANAVLAQTSNLVARCESATFDTLTDPAWYYSLGEIDIGSPVDVKRIDPTLLVFNCRVIGYDLRISGVGLSGTLYLNSLNPTF